MGHISEQKYAQLMTDNRRRFYRIAYSYVKNEQDALDIVSESTYKGLKYLKSLKESAFFITWMTRIVINTAIDHERKNARLVIFGDYMMEPDERGLTGFDEEVIFDLYDAIDILEPDEKTCIILKYFEEYTFREISEILNMPESTVKSKIYKCLRHMKNYMEGVKCHDKFR